MEQLVGWKEFQLKALPWDRLHLPTARGVRSYKKVIPDKCTSEHPRFSHRHIESWTCTTFTSAEHALMAAELCL